MSHETLISPGDPPEMAAGEPKPFSTERYTTVALLGEGGMGQVFQALDATLQRSIALKTLRTDLNQKSDSRLRFLQEAKTTGRLEHPGIPPVHELQEEFDGPAYFTMKHVKGQTLTDVIAQLRQGVREVHWRYTFAYRAQVMKSICEAVYFANLNGVYHRDIKPENVMIGEHGEVQLMDWGASFDEKSEGPRAAEPDFIGTLTYAAPERFSDKVAARTSASEVYSLGALMYELFTLQALFEAPSLTELVQSIVKSQPTAPVSVRSSHQTNCPVEYSYIIQKSISKEPTARFEHAGALAQAIQLAIQDDAPVVCPCTGVKKGLSLLDRSIDIGGGLAACLILLWQVMPFLIMAWISFVR